MSAIAFALILILFFALAASVAVNWWQMGEMERLVARHSRHPRFGLLTDTPPEGIEVQRPDGVIRVGAHERNVQRRQTPDHAPWTGEQAALTEAAEQARVELVRAQLPEHAEDVTREDMVRALAGLRALPAAEPQVIT